MKKFAIIVSIVILAMIIAILWLSYHVEGVNTIAVWCLLMPMLGIRIFRAYLLIIPLSKKEKAPKDIPEGRFEYLLLKEEEENPIYWI